MNAKGWEQIAALLSSGAKPASERRIGVETERLGMWLDGKALHYRSQKDSEGNDRPGAGQILDTLSAKHGWKKSVIDNGQTLVLSAPFGKVSLEPGSQMEVSTSATPELPSQARTIVAFEKQVCELSKPFGLRWLGIGVNPVQRVDEIDVIPLSRYAAMTEYLGRRGRLATSMMRLTTSIQINLDYESESEAIEMLRVGLACAPLSYALFANSPFSEGKESGFLSFRGEIWRNTDPDRTGLVAEAFDPGFDFVKYAQLAWQRPLMFAQDRNGVFVPANGVSLEQISDRRVPEAMKEVVVDENNRMHALRELFFEARLKPGYVEIRSIDGQMPRLRDASVAFWTGLLYSPEARRRALCCLGDKAIEERQRLWVASTKLGLEAPLGKGTLMHCARELLPLAAEGLKARGFGEEAFLEPVEAILSTGKNPAQELLEKFRGEWNGRMQPVLEHCTI